MSRAVLILTLIIAGEMIFGLPFHTARFFRPTFLDVFGLTNTQFGDVSAVYGITALLAYFPGGALADRFSARSLLTASLVATAVGGLYMATIPGAVPMAVLYGYWGITSIFLFWGALIRATRDWGGTNAQGRAFGTLEAGRGLVAAGVASICGWIFAALMPDAVSMASDQERRAAFQTIILIYSLITLGAAALTWLLVPVPEYSANGRTNPLTGMLIVFRRPIVWAQAAVIVCAYCCYKGLDNYALYAEQVLGMNEVDANRFVTQGAFLRPIAAIAVGLVADRFEVAKTIGITFLVVLLSYGALSFLAVDGIELTMIYVNVFVSFFAVFALRGIYFALLEENKTPVNITGAAVGMVSLVGFTPEIFFAPIAGRILDATPGIGGHQNYFQFLAIIAAVGILVIGWLLWLRSRGVDTLWPSGRSGIVSKEINT